MLTGNNAIPNQAPVTEQTTETETQTVEEVVIQYYKETPILAEVARCESTFRQFGDDGKALRGIVDNRDVGVMQINEHYHLKTAKALDLDIETLEGNLAYGQYLYDKQGLQPWSASSKCWSKSLHVATTL